MNGRADKLLHRLGRMSVHQQTLCITGAALVGTNLLVLLFYSIFFEDRLLLDLALSSLIVILVGYPLGYLFIGQNVRLRETALELARAARTDHLTGLLNRRSFMAAAGDAIERSDAGGSAMLYLDIDHFKRLNDTLGHAAGDAVLRQLGVVIAECVHDGAIAARIGGEEFAVCLPDSDRDGAERTAEAIRDGVAQLPSSGLPAVTLSVGISMRRGGQSLEELLRAADGNLYAAKHQGRDRVVADVDIAA